MHQFYMAYCKPCYNAQDPSSDGCETCGNMNMIMYCRFCNGTFTSIYDESEFCVDSREPYIDYDFDYSDELDCLGNEYSMIHDRYCMNYILSELNSIDDESTNDESSSYSTCKDSYTLMNHEFYEAYCNTCFASQSPTDECGHCESMNLTYYCKTCDEIFYSLEEETDECEHHY